MKFSHQPMVGGFPAQHPKGNFHVSFPLKAPSEKSTPSPEGVTAALPTLSPEMTRANVDAEEGDAEWSQAWVLLVR